MDPTWEIVRWGTAEGLPDAGVTGLGLDAGWLRVETRAGNRWFDGAWFSPVPPPAPDAAEETPSPAGWAISDGEIRLDGALVHALPTSIDAVLPDGPGLWLGTPQGLLRLRPAVTWQEGPPGPRRAVDAVRVDRVGAVWMRIPGEGWWKLNGGWDPLPGLPPEARGAAFVFEPSGEPIWAAADGAFWRQGEDGAFVRVADSPPVERARAFREDRDGAWWITAGESVVRRGPDGWSVFRLGQPARWLNRLPAGTVRVGHGGGVSDLRAAGPEPVAPDVLPAGVHINGMAVDGELWAAATDAAGLCVRVGTGAGPWRCASPSGAPTDLGVSRLVRDGRGYFWVCVASGLRVVSQAVAAAFASGARPDLVSLPVAGPASCNASGDGALAVDDRGRIYMPSEGGVVVIDPSRLDLPSDPPSPVLVWEEPGAPLRPWSAEPLALTADAVESGRLWWGAPLGAAAPHAELRLRIDGGPWVLGGAVRPLTLPPLTSGGHLVEAQLRAGAAWGPPVTVRLERRPTLPEHPATLAVLVGLLGAAGILASTLLQRRAQRRAAALEAQVNARTHELAVQNKRLAEEEAEARAQTARVHALTEARAALLVGLSHELRTPLMLVLGGIDDAAAAADPRPGLARAGRNARRLNALVEQLIESARLDGERRSLSVRRLDLRAAADEVCDRHADAARVRGVRLRVEGPPSLPGWTDPGLLDRILVNLLDNALRHTPSGGSVELRLRLDGAGGDPLLSLEVDDSGPGVPEADRERIFERFVQLAGPAGAAGGLGLGLALVREMAELLGGTAVCGTAPGGGARFTVRLPVAANAFGVTEVDLGAEPLPARQPGPPSPDALSAADVLVVEDHPELRAYLVEHLSPAFTVCAVADVAGAQAALGARTPRVLVSDVMLPDGNGIAFVRAARSARPDLSTAIISARGGPAVAEAARAAADVFFAKPFAVADLVLWIASRVPVRDSDPTAAEPAPAPPGPATVLAADSHTLTRLRALVAERLADANFGPAELASAAAMSLRSLQRLTLRAGGQSPAEFIRVERLSHAQARIAAGSVRTAGEAAAAVGMSRSYFTRVYTEWAGIPPAEAIRQSTAR